MANDYFTFKKFTVWQDKCAMKVGTDGVLLGSWASVNACDTLLDVGTGTGLIALMLAQRCCAKTDAIDIDSDACLQAKINSSASPFSDRITVWHHSLADYANQTTTKYDLIVSNPPYFVDSLKCSNQKRTLARHADSLSVRNLLVDAQKMLKEEGRIAFIFPFQAEQDVLCLASKYGFNLMKKRYVKPTPAALPKRILLELCQQNVACPEVDTLIIEEKRHQYTAEYIALTKDFYLKM